MELSPVNERIKLVFKQTGLSQTVFGERVGCTQQAISNAVNNKNQPGLDLVTSILVSYPELNTEWLVLGKGEMKKNESLESSQSEELLKADEPGVKLFNCTQCIEKEKKIEDLTREVKNKEFTIELQTKLIHSLEAQLDILRAKSSDTNLKTNTA